MRGEFPLIITQQYRSEATKWLGAIRRSEDASILFISKADRYIRLGQFLNDNELVRNMLGKPSKHIFQRLNFDPHDVEDHEDLCYQVEEVLNLSKIVPPRSFNQWMKYLSRHGTTLILVLPEAEKYLNPIDKTVLSVLSDFVDMYAPRVRVLSFFQINITHSSLLPALPTSVRLYENIFPYPLYNEKETVAFIHLLMRQWNASIDTKTQQKIFRACGGHFWLVKEAVRRIVATGSWMSDEEGMVFRLRSIFSAFLPSEQSVLQKIVIGKKDFSSDERLSFDYLKKMRVVDRNSALYIGALKHFILRQHFTRAEISFTDHRIMVNEVPVDKLFSRKEHRVMRLLLTRQNETVSRDDIAQSMWPQYTDAHYSDWAIDQTVARVRKRLIELSLPPTLIKVVRRKGYTLQLPIAR